jgi:outer membrane protein assembly factor BamD
VVLKTKKADQYFKDGQYEKALQLYENLVNNYYRGTPDAEKMVYRMAYCTYELQEYVLASYQFKNFAETYPLSDNAEDAWYYYAYCLYMDSPIQELDQGSTADAINAFQLYLDKYPDTKRAEECNKNIDLLRSKLEDKAINNALIYYKIENYKSSVWAIRAVLADYPFTPRKEMLEYTIVKSSYLYAENSVESKQTERYFATLQSYTEFKEKFPNSPYNAELEKIVKDCHDKIEKLDFVLNVRHPYESIRTTPGQYKQDRYKQILQNARDFRAKYPSSRYISQLNEIEKKVQVQLDRNTQKPQENLKSQSNE